MPENKVELKEHKIARFSIPLDRLEKFMEHSPVSGGRKQPKEDIDNLDRQERYDLGYNY